MEKKNRKQLTGKVVSNRMEKTAVVEIEKYIMHPIYHKFVRRKKRVKSHDERNECSIGDVVRIEETRPISRQKRYRLIEIIEKVK